MRHRKKSWVLAAIKPLSVFLLVLSVFTIVWLRSSVVSLEYSINTLEKKKIQLMKDTKLLAAEKSNLLSMERFEKVAANSFVIPDRIKVVHVKKLKDKEPQKVALSAEDGNFRPGKLFRKIMD